MNNNKMNEWTVNNIGDEGTIKISEALMTNTTLTILDIWTRVGYVQHNTFFLLMSTLFLWILLSQFKVWKSFSLPYTETTTIGELCEIFAEKNIGGVPVLKDDRVVGIITERDVLRAVKRI